MEEYNEQLQEILFSPAVCTELYEFVKQFIADNQRDAVLELYDVLCQISSTTCTELQEESILSVLDAMTGYCAYYCRLGTADYHLK